jgi:hypothetical protein
MKWISVKDRLPESLIDKDYLVCDNFSNLAPLSTASYFKGEWFDYKGDKHLYSEDITHWMPLPEPPKQD